MSGGNVRVPKPRLDRQKIYARLQEDHRERVPEHVRRDLLLGELRHLLGRCGNGATHHVSSAEACQALPVWTDEYRHILMSYRREWTLEYYVAATRSITRDRKDFVRRRYISQPAT